MPLRALPCLLLGLVLVHPRPVHAQGPDAQGSAPPGQAEARKAEALISSGEFEQAVRVVQQGLKNPQTRTPERLELYRLIGLAALNLGNEPRARQAYELLLELSPRYPLPKDTPPKVRTFFEQIRKEREAAARDAGG